MYKIYKVIVNNHCILETFLEWYAKATVIALDCLAQIIEEQVELKEKYKELALEEGVIYDCSI